MRSRGIAAGEIVDFTPRFYLIEGDGAVCVYVDDVAYHDAGRLERGRSQTPSLLRDGGWDYIRD